VPRLIAEVASASARAGPERGPLVRRLAVNRRSTDQRLADFGDPAAGDSIEAQSAVIRSVREMANPHHGDGVIASNQRLNVVMNQTTRDLDGVLVVVASSLRPVTGRVMAVIDVIR
jgi:hypothetical protein